MTTIIERPRVERDGGTTVIAVVMGMLAVALIGLFAFGVFDRQPMVTDMTIRTPAATVPIAPTAPQTTPAEAPPGPPATDPAPSN